MMGLEERLLTVKEVGEKLNVPARTVSRWIGEGKLKGVRLGGKRTGWRIRPSEVERLVRESEERSS